MKEAELVTRAVSFLIGEHGLLVDSNGVRDYPAKYVGDQFGGYAPAIGTASNKIVAELKACGVTCEYLRSGRTMVFRIFSENTSPV